MKNIVALGIFLAACNVYAHDIDNTADQEVSMITADCQTRHDAYEEMISQEEEPAIQETYAITLKNADGSEETIAAQTITLAQTKEVFNSPEAVEFLATINLTSDQAFDSILTLLGDVQNKTMEIEGKVIPVGGVSFAIYNTTYFVKASEFMTLENDSIVDATVEANDVSDLNS